MVKHGGPDVSVPMAWQQLSGLPLMTQTPSMEHHNKVPRPSQCMQFGNTMVAPTESTDDTISFDDTADTPLFFDQPMQDFSNDQSVPVVNEGGMALHQPSQDSAVLPSVSIGALTSSQGRVCKMSRAMAESVSHWEFYGRDKMHYMASQAVCEHDYKHLHCNHLDLQECKHHPIVFLTEMMGDIIYLHQALHKLDTRELVEAAIKEINYHINNNHWKLIPRTEVPEDTEVMPSLWALQRKQDLMMGRVTKHKARVNLHGEKQEFGRKYYDTYTPVVTWFAIRLLIVFGIQFHWAFCQVDFFMVYPQAPIKMDINMELPGGIHTKHGNSKDHVLKLLTNTYGQKQAGHVWTNHLVTKLQEINFKQSLIDDCVFYRDDVIFFVYVDN
jgi:hypothetical protein